MSNKIIEGMSSRLKYVIGAGLFASALFASGIAHAETLRLSHADAPGSEGDQAAQALAELITERTEGRIEIDVFPAGQLGDWVEVYESVSRGEIDMAMQALPTTFDPRTAITMFPMAIDGYDSAAEAFAPNGYMNEIINTIVAGQGVRSLGAWTRGMGGGGFSQAVEAPTDPNAERNLKVRIWPGGTTHKALMERLGFNVATVAWAELYTSLQTGVVDGYVGSSAQSAVANFKDVLDVWIDYQDHISVAFILINNERWDSIDAADQKIMLDAVTEITNARIEATKASDAEFVEMLRANGTEIVTFTPEERAALVKVVREEVWPEIEGEIGPELMARLRAATEAK